MLIKHRADIKSDLKKKNDKELRALVDHLNVYALYVEQVQ